MSATRDKSQKVTFIYPETFKKKGKSKKGNMKNKNSENSQIFYLPIQKRIPEKSTSSKLSSSKYTDVSPREIKKQIRDLLAQNLTASGKNWKSSHILKAGEMSYQEIQRKILFRKKIKPVVQEYTPQEFTDHKKPLTRKIILENKNPGIESLKKNLKSLNEIQARLRFMLTELEALVK